MNFPDPAHFSSLSEALSGGDPNVYIALGIFFAWGILLPCIGVLLRLVCRWRYFSKAGDRGWKALIPLYSTYTEYALFWKGRMFFLIIATSVSAAMAAALLPRKELVLLISAALILVQAAVIVGKTHRLSRAFGYGIGFTLGLIFLQPVFLLILAFGRARYIGPAYR